VIRGQPPGVLAGRALLFLLAVSACAVAIGLRLRAPSAAPRYACPMHPDVTSGVPGECSICGMALQRAGGGPGAAKSLASEAPPSAAEAADLRRGDYAVRQVAFTDAVRVPAWVEAPGIVVAHLYDDELAMLAAQTKATFSASTTPAVRTEVTPSGEPPAPWDASTSRVSFRFDPAGPALAPGAAGWLRLAPQLRRALLVPYFAVRESPGGPHVMVVEGGADPRSAVVEPRPVKIGKVFFGNAVLVSGLAENEVVRVHNTFFVEAERRLRAQAGQAARP